LELAKEFIAKTAVVTGAASGIGRAYSLALARRGWKVGLADIDLPKAEQTLELVCNAGGSGEVYRCDVADVAQVEAMADHFFSQWGKIGLLFNNAGVIVLGQVGDIDPAEWQRQVSINLMGVVYGCHAFVPRMKEQGGGHILNTASVAGILSPKLMAPYNVTKAAVISLSETLKWELAPWGIGVTAVCPSFLGTGLWGETSSTTDDWIWDWNVLCMTRARIDAGEVAERAIQAAARNRLYVLTQPFTRYLWRLKRAAPGVFFATFALMNKLRIDKPLLNVLAKLGLI
jgi:NAD(P)-dependent dehydrogenase (short-subunit alcohol dehydrogenase family)